MRSANDVKPVILKTMAVESGMEVSCITTGRMICEDHLYFTHPDPEIRKRAKDSYKSLIDMASEYCNLINIGRSGVKREKSSRRRRQTGCFLDKLTGKFGYAEKKGRSGRD